MDEDRHSPDGGAGQDAPGGPVAIDVELAGSAPPLRLWQRVSWIYLVFAALVLAGAAGLALWTIPNAQLDSVEQTVAWCASDDPTTRRTPEQCRVGGLGLARLSPLTRARAESLGARSIYEGHRRALLNGLRDDALDAHERDVWAERMLAAGLEAAQLEVVPGGELREVGAIELSTDLAELGALRLASQAVFAELELGRAPTFWQIDHAVLSRGAHERIGELAAAHLGPHARDPGLWLCLLGQREAGARLLAESEADNPSSGSIWANFGSVEQVVLALCQGLEPDPATAPAYLRSWLAARAAARDPAALTWTAASIDDNLSILAELIVRDRPSAEELLAGVGLDEAGELPAYLRWSLTDYLWLDRDSADPLSRLPHNLSPGYAPETMVRAAELVAERAAEAEAAEAAEAELGEGEESDESDPAEGEPERPAPAGQLRHIAAKLAIEAGREFIHRGQLERAREALALADEQLPVEARIALAWLRVEARELDAVIDFASGLRAATAVDEAGQDWRELAGLGLLEAEARAARGHIVQARAVLDSVPFISESWREDQLYPRLDALDELSGLRLELETPAVLLVDEVLTRLRARVRRGGVVRLDAKLDEDVGLGLREYMWRRAELARRLGDASEAERWQDRSAALLGLAKTEDEQLMLDLLL